MWEKMSGALVLVISTHLCHIVQTSPCTATSKAPPTFGDCASSGPFALLLRFKFSFFPCSRFSSRLPSPIIRMNYEVGSSADGDQSGNRGSGNHVLDIYPLSCYYFGSKEPLLPKDENLADRVLRMKSNYARHGLRTCVVAVILVELFKHPHLLLLQVKNSFFMLPGGRLRPGESDINGLKRKLSCKLSANEDGNGPEWEVGECLGMWWKPDFETLLYPYLPPNVKKPKECIKLFLVKLPESRKFIVPNNLKLLAIPLCQLHENDKTYGPIIAGVPQLLSKFSFNIVDS